MSLVTAIKPIINSKTAKVQLEVSGTTDGRMAVVAKPVVGAVAQTAPQELHALCAALATPIKVVGDPDDIEQALIDAITEQNPTRTSWATRAAELEAQIQAAAEKDAKGKKSTGKATSHQTKAADSKAEGKTEAKAAAKNTDKADAKPDAAELDLKDL